MAECLAVVFDLDVGRTFFHLLDGKPDTINLQVKPGLSTEEFFRQRGASAQKAREMFPERFVAVGDKAGSLTWGAPLGMIELHRQRPDLQKLADTTGLLIYVFRRRSKESPRLEFTLESRSTR